MHAPVREDNNSYQRRKWFASKMSSSRGAFTLDKELVLFAGTWNVNGRSPDPNNDINPWLFPHSRHPRQPVDVYMLGLQEVQTLSGVDAVRTDPAKGLSWRKKIQSTLGADYDSIAERQLVGIMVFVFVRKNHVPFVSNVQLSYAATGFLNAVGNKGGVAARFLLYNRTISCVACHLAAHTANVERRNQDFADVVRKAVFLPVGSENGRIPSKQNSISSPTDSDLQPPIPKPSKSDIDSPSISNSSFPVGFPAAAAGTSSWLGSVASVAATAFYDLSSGANSTILNDPNAINALDHDLVFWLGDLNYRIDFPLDQALDLIQKCDWDSLLRHDQLKREMKTCDAFVGFEEGSIRFPPTYKFDRFTNEYACDENGIVKRVPAYTDRILWRVRAEEDDPYGIPDLSLDEYSSAPSVLSSDHRPVYASFRMTFGVEDFDRKRYIEDDINKKLDNPQARLEPSLQFSPSRFDFGEVFFEQEIERSISIRNVGSSSTKFSVRCPSTLPQWFRFDKSKWNNVEIHPGQSTSITARVLVTNEDGTANYVCSKGCSLETTILICADIDNIEEPIEISGRYVVTTLGLSLEKLSLLPRSVLSLRAKETREVQYYDVDEARNSGNAPSNIPKEIWLPVDALMKVHHEDGQPYMNNYPSLFLARADETQVQRVLSFIDHGKKLPQDLSGDAIAICLLRILEKLDDSVIPRYAYKRAIEAGFADDISLVRSVVDLLPPLNWNVFWYIINFLCEIPSVRQREDGGKAVAREFGKVLIRGSGETNARDEKSRTSFVLSALHLQKQDYSDDFTAVIDLSNPENHPRILKISST